MYYCYPIGGVPPGYQSLPYLTHMLHRTHVTAALAQCAANNADISALIKPNDRCSYGR